MHTNVLKIVFLLWLHTEVQPTILHPQFKQLILWKPSSGTCPRWLTRHEAKRHGPGQLPLFSTTLYPSLCAVDSFTGFSRQKVFDCWSTPSPYDGSYFHLTFWMVGIREAFFLARCELRLWCKSSGSLSDDKKKKKKKIWHQTSKVEMKKKIPALLIILFYDPVLDCSLQTLRSLDWV